MANVETKFFKFDQNNSGGSFVIDDERGLGAKVWIEAIDANHANSRAESLGIYFNGCADGADCNCCGDRWSELWADEKGEPRPHIDPQWDFNWSDTVYAHALDGTIHRFRKDDPVVEVVS